MNFSRTVLTAAFSFASFAACASPATDALGTCLTDHTTGKERKDLARWAFVSMAAHPDMAKVAAVSPQARDAENKTMAALVTKLVTQECTAQARQALAEGGDGMRTSFEVLGKVAMQELMSDPSVNTSIQGFTQYLDQKKFEAVLSGK